MKRYDTTKQWYAIHTYSGYEEKVAESIRQLDRCFTTKHVHQYLELALGWVDFTDCTIEALERTIGDIYYFADVEIDLVLWLFTTHALHDLFNFIITDR